MAIAWNYVRNHLRATNYVNCDIVFSYKELLKTWEIIYDKIHLIKWCKKCTVKGLAENTIKSQQWVLQGVLFLPCTCKITYIE